MSDAIIWVCNSIAADDSFLIWGEEPKWDKDQWRAVSQTGLVVCKDGFQAWMKSWDPGGLSLVVPGENTNILVEVNLTQKHCVPHNPPEPESETVPLNRDKCRELGRKLVEWTLTHSSGPRSMGREMVRLVGEALQEVNHGEE